MAAVVGVGSVGGGSLVSIVVVGGGGNGPGVMTFLAGLELTRRRILFLRQAEPFSELWIYRREDDEDEENPEEAEA